MFPDSTRLINDQRSNFQLNQQYKFRNELVDFPYLEISNLLPVSVSIRSGSPSERRMEKRTSSCFLCGHCGPSGHNKLTCEKLNSLCTTCGLKYNNYLACRTALDDHFNLSQEAEELHEERKNNLKRQLKSAERKHKDRRRKSTRRHAKRT